MKQFRISHFAFRILKNPQLLALAKNFTAKQLHSNAFRIHKRTAMDNQRLQKIKQAEVQDKYDGLPTPLKTKIDEYIPSSEYIISYGNEKLPPLWHENK